MEENDLNSKCEVLLIGGSAGSIEVLMSILPKLKPFNTFSIVIVLHRKSTGNTFLENLVAMKSSIPFSKIEDKEVLLPGYIYVAPSNYHLLFEKNHSLSLDVSEKVNFSRPSIDVTFESAALAYGSKCFAILLSGANSDGTQGLKIIKEYGGTVILQNPKNALMPFMPENALSSITPDYVLNTQEILQFINNIEVSI